MPSEFSSPSPSKRIFVDLGFVFSQQNLQINICFHLYLITSPFHHFPLINPLYSMADFKNRHENIKMNSKEIVNTYLSFLEDTELENSRYLFNHHLSFILSDYLCYEIILMCYKKYKINPPEPKQSNTGFLTEQLRPMYY